MLKIAEYNTITGEKIDLKELEKYRFEYSDWEKCYIGGYSNRELHLRVYEEDKNREIKMYEPFRDVDGEENNIEILYDLIKDGLVEKVGGNE